MTRLTPEQIAEIKARHEADNAASWAIIEKPDGMEDWGSRHGVSANERCAALLSHIESDGWQTMETAPRDGREILISERGRLAIVSWRTDWFAESDGPTWLDNSHDDFSTGYASNPFRPTHWRPLPAPPETKEG